MDTALCGIAWKFAIPFIDDIAVFSPDPETHLQHLEEIFKRLQDAALKLKPTKCIFACDPIKYLGNLVGRDAVKPGPLKIKWSKILRLLPA